MLSLSTFIRVIEYVILIHRKQFIALLVHIAAISDITGSGEQSIGQ